MLHSQRLQNVLLEILLQAHPGDHFDDGAQHVVAETVLVPLSRFKTQRPAGHTGHNLSGRGVAAALLHALLDFFSFGIVIKAAGHREQMPYPHNLGGGHHTVSPPHGEMGILRQIIRHRCQRIQPPLFHQLHGSGGRQHFCDGIAAIQIVLRNGPLVFIIRPPGPMPENLPMVLIHNTFTARDLAGPDQIIQKIPDIIHGFAPLI